MKKYTRLILLFLIACVSFTTGSCQSAASLKIVIIRHGEKPDDGDNLNCKGFNRSLALTTALYKKFGVVSAIYVPSINAGNSTKSGRMFQTITPYAVKYNLQINSSFDDGDYKKIAKEIYSRTGTVLISVRPADKRTTVFGIMIRVVAIIRTISHTETLG